MPLYWALLLTCNVRGSSIAGHIPALVAKVPSIQGDCSGPPPASKLEKLRKADTPVKDYDLSAFRNGQCLFTHGFALGTFAVGKLWLHNLFMLHSQGGLEPSASVSAATAYVTWCTLEQASGPAFDASSQLYLDGALTSERADIFF
jgi:hypothetical protein